MSEFSRVRYDLYGIEDKLMSLRSQVGDTVAYVTSYRDLFAERDFDLEALVQVAERIAFLEADVLKLARSI